MRYLIAVLLVCLMGCGPVAEGEQDAGTPAAADAGADQQKLIDYWCYWLTTGGKTQVRYVCIPI